MVVVPGGQVNVQKTAGEGGKAVYISASEFDGLGVPPQVWGNGFGSDIIMVENGGAEHDERAPFVVDRVVVDYVPSGQSGVKCMVETV